MIIYLCAQYKTLMRNYLNYFKSILFYVYGQEVSNRYWPQSNNISAQYGKLTVTVKYQKEFSDYVMRKLEVAENKTHTPVKFSDLIITSISEVKSSRVNVLLTSRESKNLQTFTSCNFFFFLQEFNYIQTQLTTCVSVPIRWIGSGCGLRSLD